MIYKLYTPGTLLNENEYMLKLRKASYENTPDTGFLSKLTKKKEIPLSFDKWGHYYLGSKLPIYLFEETYRSGWKIFSFRYGESQNWALMIHPCGFIVEIYLNNLLKILQENTCVDGELIGIFKWKDNMLEKLV